ncbi:autotransporter-associated beta strand repeat-containing protein [Paraburkholderia sp. GAS448]|uniref:autotransporter-associated beta strand repeat-containing protein n=1 Tax=Paraburkholderia sp. GAS448 TaxID=3035136 RepID=UPI003D22C2E0
MGIALMGASRLVPRGVGLANGWILSDGASAASHANGQSDALARTLATGAFVCVPQGVTGTVTGLLSGAGSLSKTGAGVVTLTAANSWSAGTDIASGAIILGGTPATGLTGSLGPGKVTLSGAGLGFNPGSASIASIVGNALEVAADSTIAHDSGDTHLTGGIVIDGNATLTVGTAGLPGHFLYIDNAVSGPGDLVIEANGLTLDDAPTDTGGAVYISGHNGWTGTTTVKSGTLAISTVASYSLTGAFVNAAALQFSSYVSVASQGSILLAGPVSGAGAWTINGPGPPPDPWSNRFGFAISQTTGPITVTDYGNFWLQDAGIDMTSSVNLSGPRASLNLYGTPVKRIGTLLGNGVVDIPDTGGDGSVALSIGQDNGAGTFSGVLQNSAAGASLSLIKDGSGTQTLSGSNPYQGGTTINGGTLRAGNVAAFGTGPITVNAGGTLAKNGFAITNPILNNGGTVTQ